MEQSFGYKWEEQTGILLLMCVGCASLGGANTLCSIKSLLTTRRGFEGVFMGVCSSVDVTQSEGDLPDFNQSEH